MARMQNPLIRASRTFSPARRGRRTWGSERELRRRLLRADASGHDVRLEIVLAGDRRAVESAEHGELSAVRDGVGDRALEQLLFLARERRVGREEVIEFL